MTWKTYPEYKDSGLEWPKTIPSKWTQLMLRRVLKDGQNGIKIGPFGSALKLETMQNYGWKVYGQEHIISGDFSIGIKFVSDEKFRELKACSTGPGDILVTMMGSAGKCKLVPKEAELGIMDSHLLRLRLKETQILPHFAALLIDQSQYVEAQLDMTGKGSIMQGLNSNIIKELHIIIPPIEEQAKILSYLGREIERIDNLIAKKQRQIELLQEQRSALVSHIVIRGLNPNVKMKDSGVEWLGKIPEHWETERLKYVFLLRRGFDLPAEDFVEGPYPVCGSNGIIGYHNQFAVVGPAITVGRSGSVGEVNYFNNKCWPHNTALYVKMFFQSYPKFIYYLLKTIDLKSLSEGTAVGTLNRNYIHNLVIAVPKTQEQKEIADFLDSELQEIENLVSKINESINKFQEYRSALISAAVTGNIDVGQEA